MARDAGAAAVRGRHGVRVDAVPAAEPLVGPLDRRAERALMEEAAGQHLAGVQQLLPGKLIRGT